MSWKLALTVKNMQYSLLAYSDDVKRRYSIHKGFIRMPFHLLKPKEPDYEAIGH
jgi:hypothetical protein